MYWMYRKSISWIRYVCRTHTEHWAWLNVGKVCWSLTCDSVVVCYFSGIQEITVFVYVSAKEEEETVKGFFFSSCMQKFFCMLANCMNTSLHALTWESTQYICETYCCYLCMYVTKVMYVFAYCSDDFVSRQINSVTTSCWTVLICYIKETIEVLSLAYIYSTSSLYVCLRLYRRCMYI